jgi:RNA polymerase sigma-70 factor, ECF subfamily
VRARKHVSETKPRFEPSVAVRDRLAGRFFDAIGKGDLGGLVDLLAADVVVYGDSGGTSPSWPRPIVGREHVSRLLAGIGRELGQLGAHLTLVQINGHPGALVRDSSGLLINVFALDIADGLVHAVRSVINPDKLRHLGPLANVRELIRGRTVPNESPADGQR